MCSHQLSYCHFFADVRPCSISRVWGNESERLNNVPEDLGVGAQLDTLRRPAQLRLTVCSWKYFPSVANGNRLQRSSRGHAEVGQLWMSPWFN